MSLKLINIMICLSFGLLGLLCLTGCSTQSFEIGTAFEIHENDTSQTIGLINDNLHADGISNPIVQIWSGNNLLVEVPSTNDISKIINTLEQHATITSQEQVSSSSGNLMNLKNATVLIYEADLSQKSPSETDSQAMIAVKNTLLLRIKAYGISKPVVQIWGNDTFLVELPNVQNVNDAINLLGQDALLEFKEEQLDANGNVINDSSGNPVWIPAMASGSDGTQEELTGQYLLPNSYVDTNSLGKPEIEIAFDSEGAKLFGEITTRDLNKPIAIFLDNTLISEATVDAVITDKGVITGLTLAQAKDISIELNSGTLSVPLAVILQTSITP
jgi:preprotein translocase subunit SecD